MIDAWTRRRAAVLAESQADSRADERASELPDAAAVDVASSVDLDLPDPETLLRGADFRQFMAENVPAELRRRALRRLWRLDPTLANLDGLVEYGEDYTDSACVVVNLATSYEAGRGFVSRVCSEDDMPSVKSDEDARDDVHPEPEILTFEEEIVPTNETEHELTLVSMAAQPEEQFDQRAPRRMQFRFDEQVSS